MSSRFCEHPEIPGNGPRGLITRVVGSNPAPATRRRPRIARSGAFCLSRMPSRPCGRSGALDADDAVQASFDSGPTDVCERPLACRGDRPLAVRSPPRAGCRRRIRGAAVHAQDGYFCPLTSAKAVADDGKILQKPGSRSRRHPGSTITLTLTFDSSFGRCPSGVQAANLRA